MVSNRIFEIKGLEKKIHSSKLLLLKNSKKYGKSRKFRIQHVDDLTRKESEKRINFILSIIAIVLSLISMALIFKVLDSLPTKSKVVQPRIPEGICNNNLPFSSSSLTSYESIILISQTLPTLLISFR